ncbi:MAG: hypothetical protein LBR07_04240 [Puniceicoccales bacterium]|jgi:O-antigen ligase|nr:hypothetical protein [Puniceicoccales bacterium]
MQQSRLSRLYEYFVYQWRIPFTPSHFLDIPALLALACAAALLLYGHGGMSPEPLPYTAAAVRLCAAAAAMHLIALSARGTEGFGLRLEVLFFAPWLFWRALDWAFFSPKPWLAEEAFALDASFFGAFWVAAHHFRHTWHRWCLLGAGAGLTVLLALISLGADSRLAGFLEGLVPFEPLGAPQGCRAATAAALLLAIFPCAAVALSGRWPHWQRWAGAAVALGALACLLATFHLGALAALFAGSVVLAPLLFDRWAPRAALVLGAAALLFLFTVVPGARLAGFLVSAPPVNETATAATPLPAAAVAAVAKSPVEGAGTGGFPLEFEFSRPPNWASSPETPGSLPLAVLAEHGLVGLVLFLAPAVWLWLAALRACLALPRRERVKRDERLDAAGFPARPKIPEERIWLAGTLAGTAATAVMLTLDYPARMPAVALLLALQGGAMLRLAKGLAPLTFTAGLRASFALRTAGVAIAAIWPMWALAPLASVRDSDRAAAALEPFLRDINKSARPPAPDPETLDEVDERIVRALKKNPANGDAWDLAARSATLRIALAPEHLDDFAGTALGASSSALRLSPLNARFHLTRGAVLQTLGLKEAAVAAHVEARALAPGAITVLLAAAEALARSPNGLFEARVSLEHAAARYPESVAVRAALRGVELQIKAETSAAGGTGGTDGTGGGTGGEAAPQKQKGNSHD